MRIAVLGAPGSGKTKFAKALQKEISKENVELWRGTAIVDGYIDRLTKETGLAYGIYAEFEQNIQIIFSRYTHEQVATAKGAKTLITCGTIYESVVYSAIRANADAYFKSDRQVIAEGRVFMEVLGCLEHRVGAHDLLFYLPYDAATLTAKGKAYDTVVNAKIPEVVQGYFRPLVALDQKTTKAKVKSALKTIEAYQKWQAEQLTVDDQLPVRGSGEDTGAQGKDLSDVR